MPDPTIPTMRYWALVPCAGVGLRAGTDSPKQYRVLARLPLVMHTLAAFIRVTCIEQTVVVVQPADDFFATHPPPSAACQVAPCGGVTRALSVLNGLHWLLDHGAAVRDWVLVHDAARCLIRPSQIEALIAACRSDAVGGLLALPLPDTLKQSLKQSSADRVACTLDRRDMWLAQTPQMFRVGRLIEALQCADNDVSDESSAMERLGLCPKLVLGSTQNLKVTYPEDFDLAGYILEQRWQGA